MIRKDQNTLQNYIFNREFDVMGPLWKNKFPSNLIFIITMFYARA